jgi:hypothetical protein
MSETRVDPTVAGLFLIGLVTLFFGLLGLEMFGAGASEEAATIFRIAGSLIGIVGFILIIFAYMAGKVGNAFATALFAFVAVALFAVGYGITDFGTADMVVFPTLFYAIAFFFLIFAIVALLIGAPKLLAVLLFLVCLLYLFVGFFVATLDAPYAIAFGFFGFLSFIVATYMAVALATQKMPVV